MHINVTTPDAAVGNWAIQSFTVSEEQAAHFNLMQMIKGRPDVMRVNPGDYKRLVHKSRGVVMSNTPMEVRTNIDFIRKATGSVLINGLGLGMVLTAILAKPEVTKVTVIELEPDVIALTAAHFADPRLTVIQADCYDYTPPKGERYDAVWHDVWDTICADNLREMTKLKRKYARRTDWQACWCESECRRLK